MGTHIDYSVAWGPNTQSFVEHSNSSWAQGAFTLNSSGSFVSERKLDGNVGMVAGMDFWTFHGLIFYLGWGVFSFGTIISNRYL